MSEYTDKVKAINFDRMDYLVSERIAALREYAERIGEGDKEAHEAICRDLIFPAVGLLAQFIDCVDVDTVGEA